MHLIVDATECFVWYLIMHTASYITDQDNMIYEEDNDRGRMRALPEEERIKIQQQVQVFRVEKAKLDRELAKWDESGNDIIILAKQMCMIMMEMTDFTRWGISFYYDGKSLIYKTCVSFPEPY